jgi:hypothetical protein
MDSHGKLFLKGHPENSARLLKAYLSSAEEGFKNLDAFGDEELDWLQRIHDKHLDFYREERRMHFGAFALVGVAVLILLPSVLEAEQYFLPLFGALILLLVLLVPYTFVYMRYEEGVRKKMRESVIIENERQLRREAEMRVQRDE